MSRDIQTKQQNQKEVKRNPTEKNSQQSTHPSMEKKEITYSSDRWKIEFKLQKYANSSFSSILFFILTEEKLPHQVK